jgi:hypothetical protein
MMIIPSEEAQEEEPNSSRSHLLLLGDGRSTNVITATTSPDHDHHDWDRSIHVAITGLTFSGPISHVWYGLLERLVPRSGMDGVVLKMILDALLFSPMAVAGYFVWRTLLEGSGWEGTRRKLTTKWASAVLASWSFWPAANVMYVCVCVCVASRRVA